MRSRRWRVWLLAIAFACALGWVRADPVDDVMKEQMAQQKVPGAAVAVVRAGKLVKLGNYGCQDREKQIPVGEQTIFRIASVSKQFTAVGVMMLVEAGRVRIEDPVGRHLPESPATWENITVRHLLEQTSGLADFINEPKVNMTKDITDAELMKDVAGRPLKFAPGDSWMYSNTNYLLLAMIIERVTGQWYGDFLAERIFRPLGMTRTVILRTRDVTPGRAVGYQLTSNAITASQTVLAPAVAGYGGGGIESTALDLVKWDLALSTETLVKRATLERMWTAGRLNNDTVHTYGFGWRVEEIAKHRRVSHGGKWVGVTSHIDRYRDDELTVIVLTNQREATPAKMARAIAATYIPDLAQKTYAPIQDREPETTKRLEGVVRRAAEGTLKAEEFTETTWPHLEKHAEQMKRDFAQFGALQKLILVERTEQEGLPSYRYQARFARTTMRLHFVLSTDGRIVTMMPERGN